MRFILIIFLILFVNIYTIGAIVPNEQKMRSVINGDFSANKEKEESGNKILNYLRVDYYVYLILLTGGAYILIRKRKSSNLHL